MSFDSHSAENSLLERLRRFANRPWEEKVQRMRTRWLAVFPGIPLPMRLPFGIWWLARNDHVSGPIIAGNFETAEYSFVRRFVAGGMTVLDIGAHHGFYTLLSARLTGSNGRVFAFEPSRRERKALLRHVSLNRCKNVRVQAFALGAERKEAELHVVEGSQTGCNSLRAPVVLSGTSTTSVRVIPLDDWLTEENVEHVDFIKLDVEGGELDVLKGATKLLNRQPRPVVLAEVQDIRTLAWGYKAKEVIEHLVAKGYKWFGLSENGAIKELDVSQNEFDGNFVAFPEERIEEVKEV